MKSLTLYIDKWYIVGAVCTDGVYRLVNLPNHEDRIWLYFFEDVVNDEIIYSKGNRSGYCNNELHYYGDVFSSITSSSSTFTMFKHPQPMREIFKSAKIFSDLRNDLEEDGVIETYISFSKDVPVDARLYFIQDLQSENFHVQESVARIGHLALEFSAKRKNFESDGYYIVLDACNENLHYSLYQKSEDVFIRVSEDVLVGLGTDVRSRALIEHVVDTINGNEHFLKDEKEREFEYYRMTQFVDDWLVKLSTARTAMPIQLTGITLSKDNYREYSVRVQKSKIDTRTELIVKNIVDVIVRFVKDLKVGHDQVKGVVMLGDTFLNSQFKIEMSSHYNLNENQFFLYKDVDLASLVSSYSFVDCEQFSAETTMLRNNAEAEILRKRNAEAEAAEKKKAQAEAEKKAEVERIASESQRKFKEAMDRGYDSESKHDYDNMSEYFKIAVDFCPTDEEAKAKYNEALQLKAKQTVLMENYKQKIQQAKKALEDDDWEKAKQCAEEALGYSPESNEALHIKDEASRHIKHSKELERYLDRADLFIAKKAYEEALQELGKAKLLDVDGAEISEREVRIQREQTLQTSKINTLVGSLNDLISQGKFEESVIVCNELLETDFSQTKKWMAKLSEISILQERAQTSRLKWNAIQKDIDSAQITEDWQRMEILCQDALSIKDDDVIKDKLSLARTKILEIETAKKLDLMITKVKDLILSSEFSKARSILSELRKMKLDELNSLKVKELNSLIFQKEEEADMAKLAKKEAMSKSFEMEGFIEPKKNTEEKIPSKDSNPKNSGKTKLTNDDFNF